MSGAACGMLVGLVLHRDHARAVRDALHLAIGGVVLDAIDPLPARVVRDQARLLAIGDRASGATSFAARSPIAASCGSAHAYAAAESLRRRAPAERETSPVGRSGGSGMNSIGEGSP